MNHNAVEEIWMRAYCAVVEGTIAQVIADPTAPPNTDALPKLASAIADQAAGEFMARFPRWVA